MRADRDWRSVFRESVELLPIGKKLRVVWWAFLGTSKFEKFATLIHSGVSVPIAYEMSKSYREA